MKLTPDILRQNAAAMLAFADGKPIQWDYLKSPNGWVDYGPSPSGPSFDCSVIQYRPKPEPRVRPWNCPADVPLYCWIRWSNWSAGMAALVIGVTPDGIVHLCESGRRFVGWYELHWVEYSTDRREWKKCEVQEP